MRRRWLGREDKQRRRHAPLIFLGKKDLHEGGSFFLPDLFENRQRLEMWACSECGHVEFFMPTR